MSYVDGFVMAVPTNNRDAFIKHASETAAIFKEHGALRVVECWGDDVPDGKVTSFPWRLRRSPTRPWSSHGSFGLLARRGTRA